MINLNAYSVMNLHFYRYVANYYIHYKHACVLYSNENESTFFNELVVRLFQPVCKRLNLPVQPPISVCLCKEGLHN